MGLILKHPYGEGPSLTKLAKASEAIKAGMLLEIVTSGTEFQKHSTQGGDVGVLIVARERENLDIDTAYADGDSIYAYLNPPAFRGILASGENVAVGALLESNGDGKLREAVAGGGGLKVELISGGSAGDHTVSGITASDRLVAVLHASTAASIATVADLTGEFSITAADTINNAGGTDTSSDQLWVFYEDANFGPSRIVGMAAEAVNASGGDARIDVFRRG